VPALADLYNIINNITDNKGLYLVDTSSAVNTLMAIGGFLSRRVKVVAIARPIVTYGTMKAYRNIADIVKKVKNQIKEDSLNLNK
ncbi:MAG TPA: hypothetical protein DD426_13165, partial [Clostridiaceae bacterium]|nr:hypothetical protein [Clostridiaceae bacterium]